MYWIAIIPLYSKGENLLSIEESKQPLDQEIFNQAKAKRMHFLRLEIICFAYIMIRDLLIICVQLCINGNTGFWAGVDLNIIAFTLDCLSLPIFLFSFIIVED